MVVPFANTHTVGGTAISLSTKWDIIENMPIANLTMIPEKFKIIKQHRHGLK